MLYLGMGQRFGEDVRWHVLCATVAERNVAVLDCFTNEVVADVDVLGPQMVLVV